jgi:hypothetical protein
MDQRCSQRGESKSLRAWWPSGWAVSTGRGDARLTGSRSRNFQRRELVIGGWITHSNGTHGVLVGEFDGEKLRFVGIVDRGVEPDLIEVLAKIEQVHSPFAAAPLPRGIRYAQPRVVAEVQYMAGANSLRNSRLRNVRLAE